MIRVVLLIISCWSWEIMAKDQPNTMEASAGSFHWVMPDLPANTQWKQHGITVAGEQGQGTKNSQLSEARGFLVDGDRDQTILIADFKNNRVMEWKRGETNGRTVAGGNGRGNRLNQLWYPRDVLIDKDTNSLIIADWGNDRIVRWSRRSGTTRGELLIEGISCYGLAMDEQRNLYVSDDKRHEVRRYEIGKGDKIGTVVAGGNANGTRLNQLNKPAYLFVDKNQALYVADWENDRVMKWNKDAKEGIVVAGGQGGGNALTQLWSPNGIFVDTFGTVYVAEGDNHRVTRWPQGSKQGSIVVGEGGLGNRTNQLQTPMDLSFDKYGNLYVVDYGNHRVQRFNRIIVIDPTTKAQWKQHGFTVAGGQNQGTNISQLNHRLGFYLDHDFDRTILIADTLNNRIVEWKSGDSIGQVVAGGNGSGNRLDQLFSPTEVLIDKETNSLIIADWGNDRVVRWSRRSGTTRGELLIEGISCYGLAMDEQRNLYVSDDKKHEVRRYEIGKGDKNGVLVAGGNGNGNNFNQLSDPRRLFVDRNQAVYIADWNNDRIVKWSKDAKEGTVVAGGQGGGKALSQLWSPNGIFVDNSGSVYVAEGSNDRVTRWPQGSKQGHIVVGGNKRGNETNQLNVPGSLLFDQYGNLYVADEQNCRIQRFAPAMIVNVPMNARWEEDGSTIAGGQGQGPNNNQLYYPLSLFVDDYDTHQIILIADSFNNRIIQWKSGDIIGEVVAGGNGVGNRLDQLSSPKYVLIDKETNSLIIADWGNDRVVRWSRRSGTTQREILIEGVSCYGLAMDEQRNLYVSDDKKHTVRRYEIDRGDKKGVIVAGSSRKGNKPNQLNEPRYLFVDRNQSLYVSDLANGRVMKWHRDAKEGVVVAGGQGRSKTLTNSFYPNGIFVDMFGTVYVAEGNNHRVTRWLQGSKQGSVVVGTGGQGNGKNQLNAPADISFDKNGNLYVLDEQNYRVQRFMREIVVDLPVDARWKQDGLTVGGGRGRGANNSQFSEPSGFFINDGKIQTILIADSLNNRIVEWKSGDSIGQVVAGGNGRGNRLDQLSSPRDVLIDRETNDLIIADWGNNRVMRCPRKSGTTQCEAFIENISCYGLAMDEQRNLYVSDDKKHEVRRYEIGKGDKNGVLVAGGNGNGNNFNQLSDPRRLFVDRNQAVYIADWNNDRIVKWSKDAKEGTVVAGGQGGGKALSQLWSPNGIFVDNSGSVYVAEGSNDRVTRWPQGSKQGHIVVGGNGEGNEANQFNVPASLSLDKHGNLYVVDSLNHRVQRFPIFK